MSQSGSKKEPIHKPQVGWWDPRQLISTGVQVLASDLIGTRFDARREEALSAVSGETLVDYSAEPGGFWFDYMADTGDGWDSTFHMAQLVSQASLELNGRTLPRGKFLLLGGDEVYPAASKQEYLDRFVVPFETASPRAHDDDPSPYDLFAIPGNHDWYDGLVSFQRQFTQQRRIGTWQTRQQRSYFALKLPQRWWVWAVDTQLENDLDRPQVEYFRRVVAQMKDGDRLIVCIPEPDWLYGKMQNDPTLMNNLGFLLGKYVLGTKDVKAYLTLSGDLHHYRRHQHESDKNQQKIVAGGGGASMHGTHFSRNIDEVDVYGQKFILRKESQFPNTTASFFLTFKNLLFPFINPWFGILTGVTYLLLGWHVTNVDWTVSGLLNFAINQSTGRLLLIVLIYLGFYYFTAHGGIIFRLLWGSIIHGSAHLAAVLFLAGWLNSAFRVTKPSDLNSLKTVVGRAAGLYVGGHLVGSLIVGFYLLVSLNVFRYHHEEAFSGLRIKHYKNFLRLHIKADGTLEIFPVGVRKLSKPPILIEAPITITPS